MVKGKDTVSEPSTIARLTKDGRTQSLQDHTENVAKLAGSFGKKFGLDKLTETIACLHDHGKKTPAFQDAGCQGLK